MTPSYYYLDLSGQPAGPLTLSAIDTMVTRGQLQADPTIVAVGGTTWVKRSTVTDIAPKSTNQLAQEQAAELAEKARERAGEVARAMQSKGWPLLAAFAEQVGYPKLIAIAAVVLGWFFLPFVSLKLGMFGNSSFTFYSMLGAVNASDFGSNPGNLSKGLYGLLAFAAVGAALLPTFSRHRLAGYGLAAPLGFMVLIAVVAYVKVSSAVSAITGPDTMGGMFGELARDAVKESQAEIMKAISMGMGAYLAIGASLYLAWLALAHVRTVSLASAPAAPPSIAQ